MAYDRYDRDERSRWSDERDRGWRGEHRSQQGGRDERGFWDRASDEVASWFGDDDAERRRRQDQRRDERMGSSDRSWRGQSDWDRDRDRGYGRDFDRDRERGTFFGGVRHDRDIDRDQSSFGGGRSDRDFNYDRGLFNRGASRERDFNRDWQGEMWSSGDRGFNRDRDFEMRRSSGGGGYRPITGDYGRASESTFGDFRRESDRSEGPWSRDDYRRTSFAGSQKENRDFDPHYRNWRDRHMGDLDRDYDDYRREHQSKFENDFTSWREKRQQKRGLLGEIREHMEVVGKDGEHVGKVDKTAGDRLILAKSDPDSGGVHHSLSCSDIDRIEGDKVILDCSADDARNRWRDESRSRALFEREDQGEMGPRGLNRSFEGTYR
jgi:hypothetical protein